MKRKVIQLARKTLVVSLPSKWAREHNIKKGDEIELYPEGGSLMLNPVKGSALNRKAIDIGNIDVMVDNTVGALYKAGYDEVEMIFKNAKQLSYIQSVLRYTCIGFEIVEQGSNFVMTREISKGEYNELDAVLRRLFLFILSLAEDSLDAIRKHDKDKLASISLQGTNINRLADFCRRVINKGHSINSLRAAPLYVIVEQLKRIGDLYEAICKLPGNSKNRQASYEKLFEKTNFIVRKFYELFYNFSLEGVEDLRNLSEKLVVESENALKKAPEKDIEIILRLNKIAEGIHNLRGALLTAKL